MATKSEADKALEFAQEALSRTPVIILGSGASAAHGVPAMGALADHLRSLSLPGNWDDPERTEWTKLLAELSKGRDLEAALQSVRLTDQQTRYIAEQTREYLLPFDESALLELLSDRRALPLARLIRHLFSSTHRVLHIVTPNYDRLAEYAADAAEFAVHTGFTQGYLRTRAVDPPPSTGRSPRTVCVWKVHGSLDWFHDSAGRIVGVRGVRETPPNHRPLMITPGVEKYRLALGEPYRSVLGCADTALEQARAYLCVGYGFNDEHVQTKLVDRCELDAVPLVVITKELTTTARAFLEGGRCRRYVAIEAEPGGSRVYTHANPSGFSMAGMSAWGLQDFLDFTLGAAS